MTVSHPGPGRRGVTRGYVWGLIAAVTVIALALVVLTWGGIAYFTGRQPVETPGIWIMAGELIVFVCLIALVWGLWLQALELLRGRTTPSWVHIIVLMLGAYLIWCLGGVLAGLSIDETWFSPFGVITGVVWGVCSLLFWSVLARRVYTDRPTPRWPWEKRGEPGPDWKTPEDFR